MRIRSYISANRIRKVNIGCGPNIINDWLNCDLRAACKSVIYVDATKRLPFPSGSIDYFFAEHFIEHISRNKAEFFLSECYRCLKSGGRLRLSTPDLDKLILIYQGRSLDVSQEEALDRHRNLFGRYSADACMYLNDKMRMWGHKYIYNFDHLRRLLEQIGFGNIREAKFGCSDDPELRGLERHADLEWLKYAEIFIIEGEK
jgi:predicted SAM-dependent methyltransferase